jgi:hypothetical protein
MGYPDEAPGDNRMTEIDILWVAPVLILACAVIYATLWPI